MQFGGLVGSVQFPPPPGAPAPAAGANGAAAPPADNDLASALVKAGLARTAEWGLNMMTTGSFRLRELGARCAGRGWGGGGSCVAACEHVCVPPPGCGLCRCCSSCGAARQARRLWRRQ